MGPAACGVTARCGAGAWGGPGRCCPRSSPGLGLCVFPWPRTPEQRPPRGLLPRPLGRSEWTRVAHLFRPVDTEVGSPRVVSVRRTSQKRQFRRGRHQGVDAKQAGNAGRGRGGEGLGFAPERRVLQLSPRKLHADRSSPRLPARPVPRLCRTVRRPRPGGRRLRASRPHPLPRLPSVGTVAGALHPSATAEQPFVLT